MSSNVDIARAPAFQGRVPQLLIVITTLGLVLTGYFSPLALGIFAAVVVFVLAACGFRPLLWTIIFFLPVAPYLNWAFPVKDLATLLRFAFFAGTIAYARRERIDIRQLLFAGGLTWALIAYLSIAILSALAFNQGTGAAARELMRLGSYLCFYYSINALIETDDQFNRAFKALMLSSICVALFGLYQFLLGDYSAVYHALYPFQDEAQKAPEWSGRITSFLGHFNSLAGYLNLQIPLFIALALRASNQSVRRLARLALALSGIALVLTQSRGALLATVVILLLAAWLLAPTLRLRIRWLMAMTAIGVVAAILLGLMFQRLSGIDDYTEVTRLAVWAGACSVFAGSPVMGIGFGNLRSVLASFIDLPDDFIIDAHNLYLELLAETGIVGFLIFALLIFVALRRAWRLLRDRHDELNPIVGFAALAAVIGVLVHGGVDYMFHTSPQFSAMFFLILGLLNAAERRHTPIRDRCTG
jgi:putative inorganic carbon (HCO3(-)) transporter